MGFCTGSQQPAPRLAFVYVRFKAVHHRDLSPCCLLPSYPVSGCWLSDASRAVLPLRRSAREFARLILLDPQPPLATTLVTLAAYSRFQMSLDSSVMPRGVEDIPEKDLRELARWFKSRSTERRRLLKRYKTGRQKTEALAARKQVGVGSPLLRCA